MKTSADSVIACYAATRPIPSWGVGRVINLDAKAYSLHGQSPYFSVTARIGTAQKLARGDGDAGGCLHDEILRLWPQLAPIVALHLSNAITGEPMHAEANGWYWMAGALGGAGEQYHGASGSSAQSPDECLVNLAEHLRISSTETIKLRNECRAAHTRAGNARIIFSQFVAEQRPRWQAEAQAGIALLHELTARQAVKRAERETPQTVAA